MKLKLISSLLMTLIAGDSLAANTPVKQVAPLDIGVINKERIQYWLEKRGELSVDATDAQRKIAIEQFVNAEALSNVKVPLAIRKKTSIANRKPVNNGVKITGIKGLEKQQTSAEKGTTTVKVLAVMVDFPDLKHDENRLTNADTAMYYDEYTASHYSDLMFSPTGFEGPSGQNIESAYQFYQQESGETFALSGQAVGWVTADHEAAYYGSNGESYKDTNAAVLVHEAITKAVAEYNIDLSEYDKTDYMDDDEDGILDEPNGIIDQVMIFHSSVGEEAGGGVLADDAIWSHFHFVFDPATYKPVNIPNTDYRVFNYTIVPIDAAPGVVVHEFGHALGLPDEYDIDGGEIGSPVGYWSVMSAGSWVGEPAGTRPVGFSPYARDEFQSTYGGNWIDQLAVDYSELSTRTIDLVEAVNHDGDVNQIKVNLPKKQVDFGAAYEGEYQYYSNSGDQLQNALTFTVDVPTQSPQLQFMARWDIELDYDYVQVLVNGASIAGNHTKLENAQHENVSHFITGKSSDVEGAQGELAWVPMAFDLSAFAGGTVEVTVAYITDKAEGGYGFALDDIKVLAGEEVTYNDNAENDGTVSLTGFIKTGETIDGAPRNYYIQLRSHNGVDEQLSSLAYEPGVLVWYRDEGVIDNRVNAHPGEVFIGVVDADQNIISEDEAYVGTEFQIHDAAFSQFTQTALTVDDDLEAYTIFSDKTDYSAPLQPQSGIVLPKLNFQMEILSQSNDSSEASIVLSNAGPAKIELSTKTDDLVVGFSAVINDGKGTFQYAWDFGDGNTSDEATPEHTYDASGTYRVTLTVTDSEGVASIYGESVKVSAPTTTTPTTPTTPTNPTTNTGGSGGGGSFGYVLLMLGLAAGTRCIRR